MWSHCSDAIHESSKNEAFSLSIMRLPWAVGTVRPRRQPGSRATGRARAACITDGWHFKTTRRSARRAAVQGTHYFHSMYTLSLAVCIYTIQYTTHHLKLQKATGCKKFFVQHPHEQLRFATSYLLRTYCAEHFDLMILNNNPIKMYFCS